MSRSRPAVVPLAVPVCEEHARGSVQLATAGEKFVDKVASDPVEAEDVLGPPAVDVEIAVGTELEIGGVAEATRGIGDEGVDKIPSGSVVAQDAVNHMATDVEVAVRPEEDVARVGQVAALGKDGDKAPRLAVEAEDLIGG